MNDFYLSFETLFHLKMLANARWVIIESNFNDFHIQNFTSWYNAVILFSFNFRHQSPTGCGQSSFGSRSYQLPAWRRWWPSWRSPGRSWCRPRLVPWSPGHTPGQPSSQPWNEGELHCLPEVAVPGEICHLCLTSCRSSPPFCLP